MTPTFDRALASGHFLTCHHGGAWDGRPNAGVGSTGTAVAAMGTAVALPVYGMTVLGINMHNKKAPGATALLRRLKPTNWHNNVFAWTIGASRTGSAKL